MIGFINISNNNIVIELQDMFLEQLLAPILSITFQIEENKRNQSASVHTYFILLIAVRVTTSAPCSKSKGILFANRNIFRPWKHELLCFITDEPL